MLDHKYACVDRRLLAWLYFIVFRQGLNYGLPGLELSDFSVSAGITDASS